MTAKWSDRCSLPYDISMFGSSGRRFSIACTCAISFARTSAASIVSLDAAAGRRAEIRPLAASGPTVVLVAGTLDTKGEELRFIRDLLKSSDVRTRLVDLSRDRNFSRVRHGRGPGYKSGVPRQRVLEAYEALKQRLDAFRLDADAETDDRA